MVPGGVHVLASGISPRRGGYELALACEGSRFRGYIDGTLVAEVDDDSHARGMASLIADQSATRVSWPAFEYIEVREQ